MAQPSLQYAPAATVQEMIAQMSGGLDYVCWADENTGDTWALYPAYLDKDSGQIKISGNSYYVYYYTRTAPTGNNSQQRFYTGSISPSWFLQPNGATIRTSLPVVGGIPSIYAHGKNTFDPLIAIAGIIFIALTIVNLVFRRKN
jgi:hypothetical protein